MVSYKSIFSTVVLIFLYFRTTTTFERDIENTRKCISHMILSCRVFEEGITDIDVLMTHEPCIKAAIKFWVAALPFPKTMDSYYRSLIDIIDTSDGKLESPEDYCNRVFRSNLGKKNTCLSVMKDFENKDGEIDDPKAALMIALYWKRLHNYLEERNIRTLSNYGLNFRPDFDGFRGLRYLRQMCGLEEAGVNTNQPIQFLEGVRVYEPNEYAVGYLLYIAESAVVTEAGQNYPPYIFCLVRCLSRERRRLFNPRVHLLNLFI